MNVMLRSHSHRRRISRRNGLLNSLITHWRGNEASGNALDAHVNALHLTDTNTVTSNPGLVYALARQYTAANSEYHTRPGDDALLSLGVDSDFTIATWCRADGLTANHFMVAKRLAGATTIEYQVMYYLLDNRLRFYTSNGIGGQGINADTLGVPVINTWYLVICWHDSVADTINIQVNNGAVDSAVWAGGTQDGTGIFQVGSANAVAASYWNGRIGPTAFWKSAAGGGGVLTADQRTALWAGGAGLPYASFTT